MTKRTSKKNIKEHVVVVKLSREVVAAIDAAANVEGLTRSAVIRRLLLQHYHFNKVA